MKTLKKFYPIITTLLISLLQIPFSIAKSATNFKWLHSNTSDSKNSNSDLNIANHDTKSVYDSLHLNLAGLDKKAFEFAETGLLKLKEQGRIMNDSIISIIDFSQPSSNKRFYILDLKNYKMKFNTYVAHGRNSGNIWANSFSNQPRSFKSSLGFYITHESYNGNKGYSLKLEGIESGINNNADKRAIVVHGANYVNGIIVNKQGRIGRSEGCPAVPTNEAKPIINFIKDGTCLFIYNPDPSYLHRSAMLN